MRPGKGWKRNGVRVVVYKSDQNKKVEEKKNGRYNGRSYHHSQVWWGRAGNKITFSDAFWFETLKRGHNLLLYVTMTFKEGMGDLNPSLH